MKPKFFPSPSAWRAWIEEHQQKHEELWVGFYKEETRLKRLAQLIEDCGHGRTIAQLRRPGGGK
jgi:hypothetical protein